MSEALVDEKIKARMIKIIKKVMVNDEIEFHPNADLVYDIGIDSLETSEMIMEIEEVFNIDVFGDDFDAFENLTTLEQLIDLIKTKF